MSKYEVQLQFVSASHVPVGDFFNGSSDPYIEAVVNHKKDTEVLFRTSTCRSTRDPKWREDDIWHLGGVEEGTVVKLRMFDEDPRKLSNDKIGVAELTLDNLTEIAQKSGSKEVQLKVQKRKASFKVYFLTYTYSWLGAQDLRKQHSELVVKLSARKDEANHSRPCLIGPIRYDIHFSPLLGRLAGTKDDDSKVACFLGYQIHLRDVPDCRYSYTTKRPAIAMMYSKGIRGRLIRRALRGQHATIYGFDGRTIIGSAEPEDAAARLLEMADAASQIDKKMFTYAITKDGVMHFTRSGDQFAINHLSKHAMHSNSATEVVYSGEFFFVQNNNDDDDKAAEHNKNPAQTIIKDDTLVMQIRNGAERIKKAQVAGNEKMRARDKFKFKLAHMMHHDQPSEKQRDSNAHAREHHHKVEDFTLVIDNSSGTFFPDKKDLPKIHKFLESNFQGLKIKALAQDDPKLKEAKKTRRLQDENDTRYGQPGSSISSSRSSSVDPTQVGHRHPEFHRENN